ncbi:Low-density lipoprotein receptor 1 [Armadillidium nasatum]|uniref:Low-density lipoprotein receptor 1 n=1 Tax=Armadillidium nasatum TaxID=96803 RepID=A0A5N5TJA9_9CRUS|nr:Low-density lipoprotein receptor 1 [Armadillidium nasatum]
MELLFFTVLIYFDTVDPHLIVSIRFFIREIGLNDTFNKLIIDNLTNVVALDFEWESKCFFWSDVTHLSSSIKRICKDGQPEVLHTTVQSPDGIAVDWVGKNLYWCDKGRDTIEVSKIDGKYRKVLIHKGLEDPRAIVLDPFNGYMYWTDWGNKPHIGKAGMDGSGQLILINSTVGWPNALTISYATNEIFWADAHFDYIGRCDLNGGNRKIILSKESAPNYVRHIFAISVFEDWLYWTDWELKSVVRANKYTGQNINKIYTAIYRPMDLHVYHPYRQLPLKDNPCKDNGGCDTMCLLAPGGNKTCACPQNYVLEEDNKSCVPNCSASQFVCNTTYKCIPFFWKCDTQI